MKLSIILKQQASCIKYPNTPEWCCLLLCTFSVPTRTTVHHIATVYVMTFSFLLPGITLSFAASLHSLLRGADERFICERARERMREYLHQWKLIRMWRCGAVAPLLTFHLTFCRQICSRESERERVSAGEWEVMLDLAWHADASLPMARISLPVCDNVRRENSTEPSHKLFS